MFSKILKDDLSEKAAWLVKYMEKNYKSIMTMSITEFANSVHCHASFVTRTLKRVGYYGWKDWVAFCTKDILSTGAESDYAKYLNETLVTSINNTFNKIDMMDITEIINKVAHDKKIFFSGSRYSKDIARDQKRRYGSIGYATNYFDEKSGEVISIDKNGILFIISISGYTSITNEQLDYLKQEKNCTIVVISAYDLIHKDERFNYVIAGTVLDNTNIIENNAPRHSRIIILAILDMIFTKIFLKDNAINNKILNMMQKH